MLGDLKGIPEMIPMGMGYRDDIRFYFIRFNISYRILLEIGVHKDPVPSDDLKTGVSMIHEFGLHILTVRRKRILY